MIMKGIDIMHKQITQIAIVMLEVIKLGIVSKMET